MACTDGPETVPTQIFGYTPPNPPEGQPGYLAVLRDGQTYRLIVRSHGLQNAAPSEIDVPADALRRLIGLIPPADFTAEEIAQDPVLKFFGFSHLPDALRAHSARFCALARQIVDHLPRNAQRTIALNKLLEAKDAAVRAALS